jgi:hypothetical protein
LLLIVNPFVDVCPKKTRESLGYFRLENGACLIKGNLSGKVLYLRPYEYWLHLTHTMNDLGISISACAK